MHFTSRSHHGFAGEEGREQIYEGPPVWRAKHGCPRGWSSKADEGWRLASGLATSEISQWQPASTIGTHACANSRFFFRHPTLVQANPVPEEEGVDILHGWVRAKR
ncbi:hypothetical protein KM043_002073 [Ampulex compressa]|nr:hypothetical protein KM043_002073 [Ampulex compressa]